MTRKITELEQLLLDDGWYLIRKNYEGKHSEKVSFYEYTKCVPYEKDLGFQAVVKLNAERNKVINVGIPNVYVEKLDYDSSVELHSKFLFLKEYVMKITQTHSIAENKETRTLDDLELTPHEKFEIEKALGTNDLDKIKEIDNVVVLLLAKLPRKVNIIKVLKTLAENDLCQVQ